MVNDTNSDTLYNIVKSNMDANVTLITDTYRSYNGLGTVCNHITVKHTENNNKTEGDKHTNNIEGFWSLFKRSLVGTYHYMSPKHLQRYMDETSYRYNTRKVADSNRFEMAILKCDTPRITYSCLLILKRSDFGSVITITIYFLFCNLFLSSLWHIISYEF